MELIVQMIIFLTLSPHRRCLQNQEYQLVCKRVCFLANITESLRSPFTLTAHLATNFYMGELEHKKDKFNLCINRLMLQKVTHKYFSFEIEELIVSISLKLNGLMF